jgi:TatA/E family protein of Tat protein translocase
MVLYGNLGPADLTVLFVIALLLFGPKRLPEVGKQVGSALRELRKISNEFVGVMTGVRDEAAGVGQTVRGTFTDPDPVLFSGRQDSPTASLDHSEPASSGQDTRSRGLTLSALPAEAPDEEETTK